MAKKKSQFSDDELYETTSDEQITGEPVDSSVNPDGITIDPSTEDSEKVTVEMDENPVTTDSEKPVDETPVTDENPDSETPVDEILEVEQTPIPEEGTITGDKNPITDVTDETPVTDWKSAIINPKTPVDENPVTPDSKKPLVENPISDDKEPVKLNEFKRFNIRFGYSIDSRSTTTRRTLSTTEIVKQFVKAPTCFISFETKEDLKYFEILLKSKTIKVEDKEGKLVDFSDAAKKHLVERLTELSKYWISRNSK